MNNQQYIRELAAGQLSLKGYWALLNLNIYMIIKYKWPTIIVDESNTEDHNWSKEDYVSFFHQFIQYLIENKKLEFVNKIPDPYVEYYFQKIIVSFVAKKIRERQTKRSISFESVQRIGLQILYEDYRSKEINNKNYWYTTSITSVAESRIGIVEELVNKLPGITIKNDIKQIKPLIRLALGDIFSLVNEPIDEQFLIKTLYTLFEKSNNIEDIKNEEPLDVNFENIAKAVDLITKKLNREEFLLLKKYFFSQRKTSLQELSTDTSLINS